jgi:hypothetical protein
LAYIAAHQRGHDEDIRAKLAAILAPEHGRPAASRDRLRTLLDAEGAFAEAAQVFAILKDDRSRVVALFYQGQTTLILARAFRYDFIAEALNATGNYKARHLEYTHRTISISEDALELASRLDMRELHEEVQMLLGEAKPFLEGPEG